ncbi:MAG TPA: 4-(cytidine 5'-diphospho)-2-C-methyl-D-erythritol kinase [Planctomycetota bacterium]
MSARVVLRAPAKVNLSLVVLAKRADGYHELDTVLLALPLADELALEPGAGAADELLVTGPAAAGVPGDGSNLALRAVDAMRALARARGRPAPGLRVELLKRVPAQAGLGGGSSDAVAAALGACEIFGLAPDLPEVTTELARLGSDCPFFLRARAGGLARCTGRGERVEPWPDPRLPWTIALVTPGFGCATGDVYRALQVPSKSAPAAFERAGLGIDLARDRARLRNDLEAAAERSHPPLAAFRARLETLAPGAFRLAGSGSSFFGLCADEAEAEDLLARLAASDEARRYGLRGRWVLPARRPPADAKNSKSQ